MIDKNKEKPIEQPYKSEWYIAVCEFLEWLDKTEAE